MKPLTAVEKSDLKKLVTQVNTGLRVVETGWRTIAQAAGEIRERELWREASSSWTEFCEKQGWSRRRFNQLINADQVIKSLSDIPNVNDSSVVGTRVPTPSQNLSKIANSMTEKAVRSLDSVPKNKRVEVLEKVVESGSPMTAAAIKKAASQVAQTAKPEKQLDATGTKIPEPALPFWERRDEVQPWLTQLSQMKSALDKAMESGDSLYAGCTNIARAYLSQAYSSLSMAKKYAVCTDCQGWFNKVKEGGCLTCHNTGLISKYEYDHCSRKEIKEMREKANQLRV